MTSPSPLISHLSTTETLLSSRLEIIMSNPDPKTWLITGCSSGFGRILAEAALARGDQVMLTARRLDSIADLAARYPQTSKALALDVTRPGAPADVVTATEAAFGGLDILVNNAGFGLMGAVEEVEPDEYRPMFETNVFGLIEMTRAALPLLRRTAARHGGAKSGRIVNFSSVGGMTGRMGYGLYNASKFAVEGLSEALAIEVAPHGIAVTIVEPGAFRTQFLAGSIAAARKRLPDYEATSGATRNFSAQANGKQPGDPHRGVAVILQAIDATEPPLRLALGKDAYGRIREKLAKVAADMTTWEAAATATDHIA
jgi:NAD(P)-dependent dehydrogenase (short-subunit alcohol dehydrogenase family)